MPVKVVFFYNQGKQGWTETYYASGTSPSDVLTSFTGAQLGSLVTSRASPTTLYAVRCTLVGDTRLSVSRTLQGKYFGQGNLPLSFRPDPASTDAMYIIRGKAFHKRTWALRGLLDDMVQRDISGNDVETTLLQDLVAGIMFSLKAMGLGLLFQSRPPAIGIIKNPVLSVTVDPANNAQSILTLLNPPDLVRSVPRKITCLSVPTNDIPGFPKNATVVSVHAGPPHTITVAYRFRAQAIVFTPKMYYFEQTFNVDPIDRADFVGFKERKTGRPFGVSRGRTRPAVKAQ